MKVNRSTRRRRSVFFNLATRSRTDKTPEAHAFANPAQIAKIKQTYQHHGFEDALSEIPQYCGFLQA